MSIVARPSGLLIARLVAALVILHALLLLLLLRVARVELRQIVRLAPRELLQHQLLAALVAQKSEAPRPLDALRAPVDVELLDPRHQALDLAQLQQELHIKFQVAGICTLRLTIENLSSSVSTAKKSLHT